MNKHLHAEAMAQYAKDAAETEVPWERWQWSTNRHTWTACSTNPNWSYSVYYRRKRETININGYEVPRPLTEVPDGVVYVPRLLHSNLSVTVSSLIYEEEAVRRGIAHATPEDAAIHAKALLSFTEASSDV